MAQVPLAGATPHHGYNAIKRLLDILGSGLLLILLMPVFALIALWIKCDSTGPIIFRQTRVGQGRRTFTCYKFRSMRADADQAVHRDYFRSLVGTGGQGDGPHLYKVPNDSRVTRVGAFLRKTSLDELPQLWNVFIGDMSLVGPRPPITYEVEMYEPWVCERLEVLPGMTGLWQVSGRSKLTVDEMFRLDVAYARRRSLLLDLQILLRTIPAVIISSWAA
jgi:lipopolysaccharide/colanic/teichoic acid biosynthesis glycosyltransferase